MRNAAGCLLTPVLTLGFYGSIAIVLLALGVYPVLYLQDLSLPDAYANAPACGATESTDCRSQVQTEVSNVRQSYGETDFDIEIGGKTVTVAKSSGSYDPRDGDSVAVEMWRGEPVRVFASGGDVLLTDQFPAARLQTDQNVLGIFLFLGFLCLTVAVLIGWFGRRIVFARFIGMSRPHLLGGLAIVVVVAAVSLPIYVLGTSVGWLPKGRAGATVLGLAVGLLIVAAAAAYSWLRRRSGAGR